MDDVSLISADHQIKKSITWKFVMPFALQNSVCLKKSPQRHLDATLHHNTPSLQCIGYERRVDYVSVTH